MSDESMPLIIRPIEEADGYEPLVALLADESPEVRLDLARATRERLQQSGFVDSGIFVAEQEGRLVGAASISQSPGRLGSVRPPVWLESAGLTAREALFRKLEEVAREAGVATQFVSRPSEDAGLEPGEHHFLFDGRAWRRASVEELREAGYHERVDLDVYLRDLREDPPPREAGDERLSWADESSIPTDALESLVAATYEGSLDCPMLNGKRSVSDVLAGYRAEGQGDESLWQVLREGERPVGCLFMADHPETDSIELLYLGVRPEERGRGLGAEVVQQAIAMGRNRGRTVLALSADANNRPAGEIYRSLGFRRLDRREVFLKFS
jgi:mycothiol synthase